MKSSLHPPGSVFRLSAAVLSVTLLFVGVAFAQGSPVVSVDPATSFVAPGQTVVVVIKVDGVANLSAFEVHLQFNQAALEVTQLANGGFIAADFTAQNTFDNAAGTIDYAIAQLNRPAASGSGPLLAITFRGKAAGTSPVSYRSLAAAPSGVILADANGSAITVTLAPGSVTVSGAPVMPPTATATQVVPVPTAMPSTSPILGNHTVRYGESLFCIGRAYLVSPWPIAQVNNLSWPYRIYPNQVLKIPNSPWVNAPAGPVCQRQFSTVPAPTVTPGVTPTPMPTVVPGCQAQYTVVHGDTLYRIAVRFNSNIYAIAQANRIGNINLVYPGQVLCIP